MISGLIAGIVIGIVTEYYTSDTKKPTQQVAEAAKTGSGTNIIQVLWIQLCCHHDRIFQLNLQL